MSVIQTPVIIIGAGPAGVSTALFLAKKNIPCVLVEKESFPRDKICGDALSGKVVDILSKYDPNIMDLFAQNPNQVGSYGINFYSPNGKCLSVPFSLQYKELKRAPGFVSKRIHFDSFLIEEVRMHTCITLIEGAFVKEYEWNSEIKRVWVGDQLYEPQILIACDGANSIFQKQVKEETFELAISDSSYGLRAYYTNVKELHEDNFIELHFLPEILPGYFWIFPMNDGQANVGLGLGADIIKAKKLHLPALLEQILRLPQFKDRFKDASMIGSVKLHALPMGNKRRILSGDRYILAGDAAALIDPFTGEGIGNALISGMVAAQVIEEAILAQDFSAKRLSKYDELLYRRLSAELQLSTKLQSLVKYPSLFNFVVNKANKNKTLRDTISSMFEDVDIRSQFKNPLFYLKLLFN